MLDLQSSMAVVKNCLVLHKLTGAKAIRHQVAGYMLAEPCEMGTINPLANVGWPMWIGPLSSQVAHVV